MSVAKSVAFKRHFNSTADSRYMPKTIRTLPTYRMNVRQVCGERCDFDKHFTLQVLATTELETTSSIHSDRCFLGGNLTFSSASIRTLVSNRDEHRKYLSPGETSVWKS